MSHFKSISDKYIFDIEYYVESLQSRDTISVAGKDINQALEKFYSFFDTEYPKDIMIVNTVKCKLRFIG